MDTQVPGFSRAFLDEGARFTSIGTGALGGKAEGLLRAHEILKARIDPGEISGIDVDIPALTVIATDHFESFLERNHLHGVADAQERDDRIAHAFQAAALPAEMIGDLRALAEQVRAPLAVRSSSLLEDALYRPFAGVYRTKMLSNHWPDADTRFLRLAEAVKLVWASTFFSGARDYLRRTGRTVRDERMAVIVQEVVGARHGSRFYPDISGVARSYNYYRSGGARPESGVVSLALGLGKTIVDGERAWSFSPDSPAAIPPFASAHALLDGTQTRFWAVHMGKPPAYDPIRETEYLTRARLDDAEADGTLGLVASTYDVGSDRLVPGIARSGARALTFAPVLVDERIPLNRIVRHLLALCEEGFDQKVEIEFALAVRPDGPCRLGFLQVRPLGLSEDRVDITPEERDAADLLVSSDDVMGNGVVTGIHHVVYARPERLDAASSRAVAETVAAWNRELLDAGVPYLLIGAGRWGTADPTLGVPVEWADISGAKAIVEATLPTMSVEPSQGSHFFHNLSSFGASYFCVRHDIGGGRLRWDRLEALPALRETPHVRHVRLERPAQVKVDGRTGRGIIRAPAAALSD